SASCAIFCRRVHREGAPAESRHRPSVACSQPPELSIDRRRGDMAGAAVRRPRRAASRLAGGRALIGVPWLGTVHRNMYKMVVALLAADQGVAGGSGAALLSLSSIAFVAPYILFSGYAGHVADTFGKRSVVIGAKLFETAVMAMALVALVAGRIEPLVLILFL